MHQTVLSILATKEDILDLLTWFRSDRDMVIAASHYSDPWDQILLLPDEPLDWIANSTYFHLKLGTKFSEENSLFFHAGIGYDDGIRESSLGIKGDGPEFDYWKKQLTRLKRTMHHGVWCAAPDLSRSVYCKGIYYTDRAKEAHARGIPLMCAGTRNLYLLEEPQT